MLNSRPIWIASEGKEEVRFFKRANQGRDILEVFLPCKIGRPLEEEGRITTLPGAKFLDADSESISPWYFSIGEDFCFFLM